ncbi:hypothetical protein [Microlunatus ginsengisoli]|uniref:hypothetical protein n=1 Tax=Microlunatus ginsengisoli TaxID=363863 RepID=UPI0031DB4F32
MTTQTIDPPLVPGTDPAAGAADPGTRTARSVGRRDPAHTLPGPPDPTPRDRPAHRRPAREALDRATVRRVLDRFATFAALPGDDLRLAGQLLGTAADPAAVTEASLAGAGDTARGLRDLQAITGADSDMDALLTAVEIGPERVRAVNALAAAAAGRNPVRLRPSHTKAARQVVLAVRAVDQAVLDRLRALGELIA